MNALLEPDKLPVVKKQRSQLSGFAVSFAIGGLGAYLLHSSLKDSASTENPVASRQPAPEVQTKIKSIPWHKGVAPDSYAPVTMAHVVSSGETLSSIAKYHKVSVDQLLSLNNYLVDKPVIKSGDHVFLPSASGIAVKGNGEWCGKVFDLDLTSKASWVYMAQNLLCCQGVDYGLRDALTSSTQYMPTRLRRAFIEKLCSTLDELAEDSIVVSKPSLNSSNNFPKVYKAEWPQKAEFGPDHYREMASAYSWALRASITQRSSNTVGNEDAIREVIPHPFRLSPCSLIANTDNLIKIGMLKVGDYRPLSADPNFSLSSVSGYREISVRNLQNGKTPFVGMVLGVGDHNGAFDCAEHVFLGTKNSDTAVFYIESFDGADMLQQIQKINSKAGHKASSVILGGHGNRASPGGCALQVGYTTWTANGTNSNYYLFSESREDSKVISNLATTTIFFLSCKSGAKIKQGRNFVDAVAEAAASNKREKPLTIFGLTVSSNIYGVKVNSDGSIEPKIGKDGKDGVKRVVEVRKPKTQDKKPRKVMGKTT